MFNQRNNPLTRGQFNNNHQRPPFQQPPPFRPNHNSSDNEDELFETINLYNHNDGMNNHNEMNTGMIYVRNRRNGNQWVHTTYQLQPFLLEVQRRENNGERNFQLFKHNITILN